MEGGELGMWALCMASIKKLVLTKKGGETEVRNKSWETFLLFNIIIGLYVYEKTD